MCPTNSDFLKRVYESLDIAFQVSDAANLTYVYMVGMETYNRLVLLCYT